MLENLVDKFPDGFTPNSRQAKILNNIEQAFNEGHKFVIVAAPTGAGKSHIAKTLGNSAPSASKEFQKLITSHLAFKKEMSQFAYEAECLRQPSFGAMVLTITKSLQDQYTDLFEDIRSMKGKSNYICAIDDEYTVDIAPCLFQTKLKTKCQHEFTCPYYNARIKALVAKCSTLNYKMFFTLPHHVKRREYLICDEASELEDELVKQFSVTIPIDVMKKMGVTLPATPISDKYGEWKLWVQSVSLQIYERIGALVERVNKSRDMDKTEKEKFRKYIAILQNFHNSLFTLNETFFQSEYQIQKEAKSISFIPLKVDRLAQYLFDAGQKIVLMSATIIDPDNFAKTLGIKNFKYIEVDSPFNPAKAPIKCSTMFKLSHKTIDAALPGVIRQIEQICEAHKGDKGIIHTHSNKITEALQSAFILDNRFLYREKGVSNEQILDIHFNTDSPTVLVSPSMSFGVDLKGDKCKFQIIMKAPYSPLGDVRVKKMFDLDKQWYTNKMLSSIIQACGRGVRSSDDECVTYILDGVAVDAILRNKSKLPHYFLERFM